MPTRNSITLASTFPTKTMGYGVVLECPEGVGEGAVSDKSPSSTFSYCLSVCHDGPFHNVR